MRVLRYAWHCGAKLRVDAQWIEVVGGSRGVPWELYRLEVVMKACGRTSERRPAGNASRDEREQHLELIMAMKLA